jgi:5,10-methylenetetrahydromethanopterin reductase
MRIGINGSTAAASVHEVIKDARAAHDNGFSSFWLAQIFGVDALTALALAGSQVPGIELGTAVVPVQPRHPQMLASQALTVQAATEGRLALGIGLSHQIVVESSWGMSYAKPYSYLQEYLEALVPMLRGEQANVRGEQITAVGSVTVEAPAPPPVLVAALGPRMLKLTGRVADGTITWCTGPRTLASHIVPTIGEAAAEAGRPTPRVVASLPIAVTDDPDGTRAAIARGLQIYGQLPSYRAMLDREGVEGPADLAMLGDEDQVGEALSALADTGVTDFAAVVSARTPDEVDRTIAVLADFAARS